MLDFSANTSVSVPTALQPLCPQQGCYGQMRRLDPETCDIWTEAWCPECGHIEQVLGVWIQYINPEGGKRT